MKLENGRLSSMVFKLEWEEDVPRMSWVAAFNFRGSEDIVPSLSQLGRIRLKNKGFATDPNIARGT